MSEEVKIELARNIIRGLVAAILAAGGAYIGVKAELARYSVFIEANKRDIEKERIERIADIAALRAELEKWREKLQTEHLNDIEWRGEVKSELKTIKIQLDRLLSNSKSGNFNQLQQKNGGTHD